MNAVKRCTGLCLIVVMAACVHKDTHSAARELDRNVSAINDSMFVLEKQWSKTMAYAISSGNYSKLKPSRTKFEIFLKYASQTVSALQDTDGSQAYKAAELELISCESDNAKKTFPAFEKLRVNTPMIEVTTCLDNLKYASNIEKNKIDLMKTARSAYQEKNGFLFSEKALQEQKKAPSNSNQ